MVSIYFLSTTAYYLLQAQGLAFNITKSNALPAISVNTSFTPFNESISCPLSSVGNSSSFTAQVKVDVAANAYAQVHYGLAAIGKLIPPELTDFGIFASLDANLDGNLKVASSASVCTRG